MRLDDAGVDRERSAAFLGEIRAAANGERAGNGAGLADVDVHVAYAQGRLGGVNFYALLCQELFGVLPAKVQLLYLGDGTALTTQPTDQATRALRTKVGAIWQAVETACQREDFRPRPGPLCNWCSFQAYCPSQGGDISLVTSAVSMAS